MSIRKIEDFHKIWLMAYDYAKNKNKYCPNCAEFGHLVELKEEEPEGYIKHVANYNHNSADGIFSEFVIINNIFKCPACLETFKK